jgi:hypothetical protein
MLHSSFATFAAEPERLGYTAGAGVPQKPGYGAAVTRHPAWTRGATFVFSKY